MKSTGNKYLVKVAEIMSHENRSLVRPVLEATAASVPADIAGVALGNMARKAITPRFGPIAGYAAQMGSVVGIGGVANAIALKHSLHGKMNND